MARFRTPQRVDGTGTFHLESQLAASLCHDGISVDASGFMPMFVEQFEEFAPASTDIQNGEGGFKRRHPIKVRQVNCLAMLDVFTGCLGKYPPKSANRSSLDPIEMRGKCADLLLFHGPG